MKYKNYIKLNMKQYYKRVTTLLIAILITQILFCILNITLVKRVIDKIEKEQEIKTLN